MGSAKAAHRRAASITKGAANSSWPTYEHLSAAARACVSVRTYQIKTLQVTQKCHFVDVQCMLAVGPRVFRSSDIQPSFDSCAELRSRCVSTKKTSNHRSRGWMIA